MTAVFLDRRRRGVRGRRGARAPPGAPHRRRHRQGRRRRRRRRECRRRHRCVRHCRAVIDRLRLATSSGRGRRPAIRCRGGGVSVAGSATHDRSMPRSVEHGGGEGAASCFLVPHGRRRSSAPAPRTYADLARIPLIVNEPTHLARSGLREIGARCASRRHGRRRLDAARRRRLRTLRPCAPACRRPRRRLLRSSRPLSSTSTAHRARCLRFVDDAEFAALEGATHPACAGAQPSARGDHQRPSSRPSGARRGRRCLPGLGDRGAAARRSSAQRLVLALGDECSASSRRSSSSSPSSV